MKKGTNEKKHTVLRFVSAALSLLLCISVFSGNCAALTVDGLYGDEPDITSEAAILYEVSTGEVTYSKNVHEHLYPASTTKVMTALLTLENCDMDEIVTVNASATGAVPSGSSIAGLYNGEQMTVKQMLICLLLPSGNDAANVLAEHVAGSIDAFVEMMNDRAQKLGCTDTQFANPHGFHDERHYTSANDLLLITLECKKYDVFNEIVASEQMSVPPTNKCSKTRYFNNTNYMISAAETSAYIYPYCTGIKTGTTTEAGRCLIASAVKGGRELVLVILKAATNYTVSGVRQIMSFWEAEDLFEWGFNSFEYKTVVSVRDVVAEVPVNLGEGKDYVTLHPAENFSLLMHDDMPIDALDIEVEKEESVDAPVAKEQVIGRMHVSYQGTLLKTIELKATDAVEQSQVLHVTQQVKDVTASTTFRLLVVLLVIALTLYIVITARMNRKRREKRQRKE